MSEGNGNGWKERMDRVERGLEHLVESAAKHDAQIGALAARQEAFESSMEQLLNSQKHLLTSQVVLTDRVEKMGARLEAAAVGLAEAQKRTDEKLNEVGDKLNALIGVVDNLVRRDRGLTN